MSFTEKVEKFGDGVCLFLIVALGIFGALALIWFLADSVSFYTRWSVLKDLCF